MGRRVGFMAWRPPPRLRCGSPGESLKRPVSNRNENPLIRASLHPPGMCPPSQGVREGREIQMKRAIVLALMLIAVLAPLASIAYADLASDDSIQQAP